jgi:hypothetical protein
MGSDDPEAIDRDNPPPQGAAAPGKR